ncbi:hypothetical protein ABBQ38_013134 [Trebouxia sp. C0009 RCD-2024]
MPPWGVAGARKSTCCSASVVPRSGNFTGGKRHQTDITSVVHSQAENADTPAPFVPSVQAIESEPPQTSASQFNSPLWDSCGALKKRAERGNVQQQA